MCRTLNVTGETRMTTCLHTHTHTHHHEVELTVSGADGLEHEGDPAELTARHAGEGGRDPAARNTERRQRFR